MTYNSLLQTKYDILTTKEVVRSLLSKDNLESNNNEFYCRLEDKLGTAWTDEIHVLYGENNSDKIESYFKLFFSDYKLTYPDDAKKKEVFISEKPNFFLYKNMGNSFPLVSSSGAERILPTPSFDDLQLPKSATKDKKSLKQEKLKKQLSFIMADEFYTSGEISQSEIFVENLIAHEGKSFAMDLLMQFYLEHFAKPRILVGLLHMLSHFKYDIIYPHGQTIALGLLQHSSSSVQEFAIKAFENWNNKKSLKILKNIKCGQQWLQDYLDEVIFDIENE